MEGIEIFCYQSGYVITSVQHPEPFKPLRLWDQQRLDSFASMSVCLSVPGPRSHVDPSAHTTYVYPHIDIQTHACTDGILSDAAHLPIHAHVGLRAYRALNTKHNVGKPFIPSLIPLI
jgi:hypothetical protein